MTPNAPEWNSTERMLTDASFSRLQRFQAARQQRLLSQSGLTARQLYNCSSFQQAREQADQLQEFAANIPSADQLQNGLNIDGYQQYFLSQNQLVLLGFTSNVACAADIELSGFDTHSNHDQLQEPLLGHLAEGIDYLWTYADQLGIADRLTVVVGSDFGRTPFYNSENGKDHWPIGSVMVMEKNPSWGDRAVGATDEGRNALAINADSLLVDRNGTHIYIQCTCTWR